MKISSTGVSTRGRGEGAERTTGSPTHPVNKIRTKTRDIVTPKKSRHVLVVLWGGQPCPS